ncbi:MAG: T9SS type A sorting domain-containing protein, partial [Bacteroidia bacterium]|nr:T9SS type A sorting domain-containing protein [Bacteroidia bacterium]
GGPNFHIDCGSTLISKSEAPHLRIFPNPASEELNIEINFLQSRKLAYSVSDISGKIIFSEKINLSAGNSFSINTDKLSSGIYFVNLTIDERSMTKKVCVSK